MLKVIEKEMRNIILLMIFTVFGMSVEKQCKEFMYPHPHNEFCLYCRICPDLVVANKDKFRQQRETQCGNATLLDGRKVQCGNIKYDRPTCPTLTPRVGNIECEDNSTVYTSCRLTCPKGYLITNELNLTCLPHPHLHWDHQLPVCEASFPDKDRDFSEKHAHKVLNLFVILSICLLFLFCPCLVLIFLIQCKKRENQIQQQTQQEVPQTVKILLKNAKRPQRSYVLKNFWVAKRGDDVTVTAHAKSVQIKHLIVIKDERMTDPPVYSALLTAPNEIVFHSVTSRHKGWYSWTAHLSDNRTECGRFHLDVRQIIQDGQTYSRSNSREAGYEVLQEEEDTQIPLIGFVGFDSILKNTKDMKRLSVLFDQDRQQGLVTWHVIATSPLIMYDTQQVQNEEYNIRSKSTFSPTFKMISILHQRGKSVKDLRDFLLTHLSSTAEAIQILDKYL